VHGGCGHLFLAALTASVLARELLEQLAGGRPTFSSSSPNPIGRLGSHTTLGVSGQKGGSPPESATPASTSSIADAYRFVLT
jgi:hypothetical protein